MATVQAMSVGLAPLDEVATHWQASLSEGGTTDGPTITLATALDGLGSYPLGRTAAVAVICAWLNQNFGKTGCLYFTNESGALLTEYMSSKPAREAFAVMLGS
jgi:hypothetical protein